MTGRWKRKPDRITAPADYGKTVPMAIYHAVQPLDVLAVRMEEKWGVNRLPGLVTPATAAKFGSAKAKLDAALEDNDVDAVVRRAAVMIRGWQAMDAEAAASGAQPCEANAWVWRDDNDVPHAFVRDVAEATAYQRANPGVNCWSMDEVVRVAASFSKRQAELITSVKDQFPGAQVSRVGKKLKFPNDEIPF
mgnify:FL=1